MKDTDTDPVAAEENTSPAPETTTDDDALWNEIIQDYKDAPDDESAADDKPKDFADLADEEEDAEKEDAQEAEDDDAGSADRADPEKLQSHIAKIERQFLSEQERAKGQQRRADKLQQEVERLTAALKSKPTESSTDDDERQKRLASVSEEYGDIVAPLLEEINLLNSRVEKLSVDEKSQLESAQAELAQVTEQEYETLLSEHPDGLDVIAKNRDVFAEWIEDQPKRLRDAYERNRAHMVDGMGAALVVSHFKAALAGSDGGTDSPSSQIRPKTKRDRQLQGARTTKQTTRQASPSAAADEDEDAIWNRAVAIETKRAGLA